MGASGVNQIGVVVIGRNDGARLGDCLRAAGVGDFPVVYVDSGSTDGSVTLAESFGVRVVVLEKPFTAARARQAGLAYLLERLPGLEYVQFLDGDCIMDGAWLPVASKYMEACPRIGGISGRRIEQRCEALFYSRLLDIDWDQPAGEAEHVGGDSLLRVAALRQVDGWAGELIAGEDPDISFRMRDQHWQIMRLQDLMTTHDANMHHFSEYWRRAVRSGHAYAEVGFKHRRGAGKRWVWKTIGILFYGMLLPLLSLLGLWRFWPFTLLVGLVYARMFISMVRMCRGRGRNWGLSLAYASLNAICKVANVLGVIKYWWGRARGQRSTLIEYKQTITQPDCSGQGAS